MVSWKKGNHKQWVVKKLCSQIFIPTACTKTKDENLVLLDFENWFHFISNVGNKKQYAQVTHPELTKFLYSWFDFKKNESIPFVSNA